MLKIIPIIVLGSLLFIGQPAFAGLVPCGAAGQPACTFCHFFVLFKNIIDFVMQISFAIAALLIALGGFMYLTSVGDEGRLRTAKAIIQSVVVGIVIILVSWVLINTLFGLLGLSTFGIESIRPDTWWRIDCAV